MLGVPPPATTSAGPVADVVIGLVLVVGGCLGVLIVRDSPVSGVAVPSETARGVKIGIGIILAGAGLALCVAGVVRLVSG